MTYIETNSGPPMNDVDPTLIVKPPYGQGAMVQCLTQMPGKGALL